MYDLLLTELENGTANRVIATRSLIRQRDSRFAVSNGMHRAIRSELSPRSHHSFRNESSALHRARCRQKASAYHGALRRRREWSELRRGPAEGIIRADRAAQELVRPLRSRFE